MRRWLHIAALFMLFAWQLPQTAAVFLGVDVCGPDCEDDSTQDEPCPSCASCCDCGPHSPRPDVGPVGRVASLPHVGAVHQWPPVLDGLLDVMPAGVFHPPRLA